MAVPRGEAEAAATETPCELHGAEVQQTPLRELH